MDINTVLLIWVLIALITSLVISKIWGKNMLAWEEVVWVVSSVIFPLGWIGLIWQMIDRHGESMRVFFVKERTIGNNPITGPLLFILMIIMFFIGQAFYLYFWR